MGFWVARGVVQLGVGRTLLSPGLPRAFAGALARALVRACLVLSDRLRLRWARGGVFRAGHEGRWLQLEKKR